MAAVLKPPTSVPGPYVPTSQPPGLPNQRQPHVRYYTVNGDETLYQLAMTYFGNPREAIRIFNANRAGSYRDDRTPGFLNTLNDSLPAGSVLLIPN